MSAMPASRDTAADDEGQDIGRPDGYRRPMAQVRRPAVERFTRFPTGEDDTGRDA